MWWDLAADCRAGWRAAGWTSWAASTPAEHAAIGILPLLRHVRPVGHRRAERPTAPRHGHGAHLHLRRLPGRRRHRGEGVRAAAGAVGRDAGRDPRLPVRRRLPELCAKSPNTATRRPLCKKQAEHVEQLLGGVHSCGACWASDSRPLATKSRSHPGHKGCYSFGASCHGVVQVKTLPFCERSLATIQLRSVAFADHGNEKIG